MKNQSNNKLPLILQEAKTVLISFDEQEKQYTDETSGRNYIMYEYESVRMDKSITYSKVIDNIVSEYYPNDKMQAVINNYLKNPEDKQRLAEFNAMQAWRDKAKEIARQIFPQQD